MFSGLHKNPFQLTYDRRLLTRQGREHTHQAEVKGTHVSWEWGPWGPCDAICGYGMRSRERYCGNKPCDDGIKDKHICRRDDCVGSYSSWVHSVSYLVQRFSRYSFHHEILIMFTLPVIQFSVQSGSLNACICFKKILSEPEIGPETSCFQVLNTTD